MTHFASVFPHINMTVPLSDELGWDRKISNGTKIIYLLLYLSEQT